MVSLMDIILLAILVAFIIKRLYAVFGTNPKNNKLHIIVKTNSTDVPKDILNALSAEFKQNPVDEQKNSKDITDNIPNFNKNNFIDGAKRVFEIVVSAFNNGNIENIKNLVSTKVFNALNCAIQKRIEQNISAEVDFIGFDNVEIKNVKILKNSVKIIVNFVSQQVNILKDINGNVILGDENFVQKISDSWTFERPLYDNNNAWKIVSTKKDG